MGDVYWAPAHEPPPLRSILEPPPALDEDSPWLHVGHTTKDGLSVDWGEPMPVCASLRETLARTTSVAAAFEVPLHVLGAYEPPPRTSSVRIDYWLPTLRHAPWKQPGLTGRRYRIARRQFARARRDWIRAGRPTYKHSTFIPAADITLEMP